MTTVRVVRVGPLVAACEVAWLVRAASRSQQFYHFEVGDPVQSLGAPDEDGAYRIDDLIDILVKSRAEADGAILVGIVDAEMGDECFSAVNRENDCILVSIDGVQPILEKTRTTLQGYVLVEVAAQLLTIAYRQRRTSQLIQMSVGYHGTGIHASASSITAKRESTLERSSWLRTSASGVTRNWTKQTFRYEYS